MERGIFGSTISLGGLLNDSFLTDGETDQFLKEFEQGVPKDLLDVPACGEADSGATSFNSTFSGLKGEGLNDELGSCTPTSSATLFQAATFPTLQSTATQGPPQLPTEAPAPNSLAVLGQLLAAIGTISQQAQQQQQGSGVQAFENAFKPAASDCQLLAPVSRTIPITPSGPEPAAVGQLGNSKESKKVRRMLSNRESARRSRHRKQAHMQQIEVRAATMEADNQSMKAALARASEQETRNIEERARLYSELATLRTRVAELEQAATTNADVANLKAAIKPNVSGSSIGGGSTASCCDSLPIKREADEAAAEVGCKRCRLA